jgi:hypothetical protein
MESSETDWNKVIFTDDKKWNLVGNDGYLSTWVWNCREEVPPWLSDAMGSDFCKESVSYCA